MGEPRYGAGVGQLRRRRSFHHPIGITHDRELVFGLRRLRACERLDMDTITARVVYLDEPLRAERDENECRKDFAPSEMVAIGRAIEEREAEKAAERKREAGKRGGASAGRSRPKQEEKGSDESSEPYRAPPKPAARDVAAAAVGVAPQTYARAKAVVEAAERDPDLAPVVEAMDRTGNVAAAYRVVQKVRPAGGRARFRYRSRSVAQATRAGRVQG